MSRPFDILNAFLYKRKQIRRRRERQLINKNLQNSKFDETVALLKPKFKQTLKRARKSSDNSEVSEAENYTRAVIDADSDIFTEVSFLKNFYLADL